MIELYIENEKVDLREGTTVAFNYSNTDTEDPSAIKNTFSTTIEIDGTKQNNKIFGHIWRLDKSIQDIDISPDNDFSSVFSGDNIFTNFDATKRVNFTLVNNGDVFESGYLQLNGITVQLNTVVYSITLYGGLGDFFYTLMYNEDNDKEKTLEDIFFGWANNIETENKNILTSWNRNYISNAWNALKNGTSNKFLNDIVPIPAYNGEYSDFDNNKIIVDLIGYNAYSRYVPSELYSGENGDPKYTYYRPYNGKYGLIEVPRGLVEWEAKEFRSQYQRFGLKFSSFMEAVSDPRNNGGFEVELDEDVKNSPYYTKTYILMNTPDFDVEITPASESSEYIGSGSFDLSGRAVSGSTTIVSNANVNFLNPKLEIDFNVSMTFNEGTSSQLYLNNYDYTISTTEYKQDDATYNYWSGILMRALVYDAYSGAYLGTTDGTLFTNTQAMSKNVPFGQMFGQNGESLLLNELKDYVNRVRYATTPINSINVVNYSKYGSLTTASASFKFGNYLPSVNGNVRIVLDAVWVGVEVNTYYNTENDPNLWYISPFFSPNNATWFDYTYPGEAYKHSGYTENITFSYSAKINDTVPETGNRNVRKKNLFGSSKTPFKYLTDFTKMFGLKYRYDTVERKIYIEKRENYYKNEIEKLTVDFSKGVKINPVSTTNKWYKFALETPESYASILYNKKNNNEYGSARVNTDYDFNNEEKNLMDGNVYKNVIPYRLSSYFFKKNPPIPNVLLFPSFEYTLYNGTEDSYTVTMSKQFSLLSDYTTTYSDTKNRLCLFSLDNGYMEDIDNALVIFNGFEDNSGFRITDDVPEMIEMNEKPCYLLTTNNGLAIQNVSIPLFNKYIATASNEVTTSLDFVVPEQIFGDNTIKYNENATIYYQFWGNYMKDLYNKNTKIITVNAFVKENPIDAMRKFYFFDNCYWVISKINNYTVGNEEPIQVELIKVNDMDNYLKKNDFTIKYQITATPNSFDFSSSSGSKDIEVRGTKYVGSTMSETDVIVLSAPSWVTATTTKITCSQNTTPNTRSGDIVFAIKDDTSVTVSVRVSQVGKSTNTVRVIMPDNINVISNNTPANVIDGTIFINVAFSDTSLGDYTTVYGGPVKDGTMQWNTINAQPMDVALETTATTLTLTFKVPTAEFGRAIRLDYENEYGGYRGGGDPCRELTWSQQISVPGETHLTLTDFTVKWDESGCD